MQKYVISAVPAHLDHQRRRKDGEAAASVHGVLGVMKSLVSMIRISLCLSLTMSNQSVGRQRKAECRAAYGFGFGTLKPAAFAAPIGGRASALTSQSRHPCAGRLPAREPDPLTSKGCGPLPAAGASPGASAPCSRAPPARPRGVTVHLPARGRLARAQADGAATETASPSRRLGLADGTRVVAGRRGGAG